MKRIGLLFLMVGLWFGTAAQSNLDSLYAVWKDPQRPDSVRADAYYDLILDGYLFSKPDTAYLLADTLIAFAEAHDLPGASANAYTMQGNALGIQGRFARAISCYEKSIAISEALGKKEGMVIGVGNIGVIYARQGNTNKALDYYRRSYALSEEIGHKKGMASNQLNLGIICYQLGDTAKALEYYQRSLVVFQEIGDKPNAATCLSRIGDLYLHAKDDSRALDYYQQSLHLREEANDKYGRSMILRSIGEFHAAKGDKATALDHFQRSLALTTELGNQRGTALNLIDLGAVHEKLGDHHRALENCSRAMAIAQEIGAWSVQREACQCLYDAYKAMGKGNEALRSLEQLRVIEDTLQAGETTKKMEQLEFARQMFADSVAKAEETRVITEAHQEEIRKKNRTRNYLALGGIGLLVVAGGLYGRARYMRRSRDIISKERDRSENLLLNILPAEIAAELKEKGRADARDFEMVSILFTDFKGFTEASAKLSAQDLVTEINTCFEAFDGIIGKHGIEKIKTIGDAYMAAGGLPVPTSDSVRNTVLAALDMQAFIEARHAERSAQGLPAFRMRIGIHTGPVVAGIVGVKKFAYDIWGDTVNTASRMESSGEVGQVNISEATYALVKDAKKVNGEWPVANGGSTHSPTPIHHSPHSDQPAFTFTPRGKVQAKGKGEMEMYFVERS